MTEEENIIRDAFERNNFKNQLVWLNAGNKAGITQISLCEHLIDDFPDEELIGLEIGSAYGGGVEFMAKCWYGRGRVYGYDTFEGHPKDLADNQKDLDAWCMDGWYKTGVKVPALNIDRLKYDYQREVLDRQMLDNANLVKGRINKNSFDNIKTIHLAMLDLDMIGPTRIAYNAIKDKFVPGGYLLMHDALPPDHLPKIHNFAYNEVLKDGLWRIMFEVPEGHLTVFKRKL